jgi:hypothetical protein
VTALSTSMAPTNAHMLVEAIIAAEDLPVQDLVR